MSRIRRRYASRKFSKANAKEQQAAAFLVRLYAGDLSADEECQIRQWRAADPTHEYAFSQQQAIWLASTLACADSNPPDPIRIDGKTDRNYKPVYTGVAAVAASALLMVTLVMGSGLQQLPVQPEAAQITESAPLIDLNEPRRYLITAAGEVDTLRLSDGSQLTLNSSTIVEFMFNANERKIRLLEGEAFFDVVPDPHGRRPFVITNGDRRIEVVGTRFNVRARDQRFEVAVINGQVNLYHRPGEQLVNDLADNTMAGATVDDISEEEPMLELTAGFYVAIDDSPVPGIPVGNHRVQSSVASSIHDQQRVLDAQRWRQGVVRLDNVPLKALVAEFNRYHSDKLRVGDEEAGELMISGVFHLSRDDELLEALKLSLPVRIEHAQQGRTLHYHP